MSLIQVKDLEVIYGSAAKALFGLSMEVKEGSIVTLVGANGAGKTTLIRAITGLLSYHSGSIVGGEISLFHEVQSQIKPHKIVRKGLAQVPEGRGILPELSVEENLRIGGFNSKDSTHLKEAFEDVYAMFPVLKQRAKNQAGYLSGGEQQMLSIGRALMSKPKIIVLDEPSLGLAPAIVLVIQDLIAEINKTGTTILLVEQNVSMALDLADWVYVLERGQVARQGSSNDLRDDDEIRNLYLGSR